MYESNEPDIITCAWCAADTPAAPFCSQCGCRPTAWRDEEGNVAPYAGDMLAMGSYTEGRKDVEGSQWLLRLKGPYPELHLYDEADEPRRGPVFIVQIIPRDDFEAPYTLRHLAEHGGLSSVRLLDLARRIEPEIHDNELDDEGLAPISPESARYLDAIEELRIAGWGQAGQEEAAGDAEGQRHGAILRRAVESVSLLLTLGQEARVDDLLSPVADRLREMIGEACESARRTEDTEDPAEPLVSEETIQEVRAVAEERRSQAEVVAKDQRHRAVRQQRRDELFARILGLQAQADALQSSIRTLRRALESSGG